MSQLKACQFCFNWHEPVDGRVPSETCNQCWLEINAQLMMDADAERRTPLLCALGTDSYFFVPETFVIQ